MIRLEGLQVWAGELVLAVADLAVAPGEYLIVLGPTASGKTVLLETVAGLRRASAGRVLFGERDVTGEPPERRGVGLVYQDYALFPHLKVADNIGFGVTRHGAAAAFGRDRVRDLAALLGVDQLLDRYPEGLSGGEQQRIALARALATSPDILLLDEPLAALDGPTRQELRQELRRLHQTLGTTVIHVTHDLDEAMALGDRIAVLIEGQLRQLGTPAGVTRWPADPEVAALVGVRNLLRVDGHATSLAEGSAVVRLEGGVTLATEGPVPAAMADRLYAAIRAEEIEVEPAVTAAPAAGQASAEEGSGLGGNVLVGTVRRVELQSAHALVEVEVETGGSAAARAVVLTGLLLRPQIDRLGLVGGSRVRLRIAPAAVHLCAGSPEKTAV